MRHKFGDRTSRSAVPSHAIVAAITFIALIVAPSAAVAQGLQWMHLLSPGVGWVASRAQVFWTTDDGQHWKDITPPQHETVISVFFLNDSMGWVLMSRYEEPEPRFDLALTKDSGRSWSSTLLSIPINPRQITLGTGGHVQFTDSAHGWMNLSVLSGPAFHLGLLLQTADGGASWSRIGGPTDGEVRFVGRRNGWILSPEGTELWVTHDTAASWQRVVLAPPPQVRLTGRVYYDLPAFSDDRRGAVIVTFSASANDPLAQVKGSDVALFTTADSGESWKFDSVVAHVSRETSYVTATTAGSDALSAQTSGDTLSLTRTRLSAPGGPTTTSAEIGPSLEPMSLSFVSDQQGWAMASVGNCSPAFLPCTRLLSTANGGAAWVDITPGGKTKPAAPSGKPIHLNWQPAGVLQPSSSDEVSIHLGFDVCAFYDAGSMADLWSESAFQDVGVYIGGNSVSSGCNPNSSWINTVELQGWGVVPLWSGPQAPCACDTNITCETFCCPFPHQFSTNPQQASTDGAQEADNAYSTAQALGLGGGIIYYDLEAYNSAQCGAAATAFVDGWDTELQNTFGQLAGVYSAPADAATWASILGGNPQNDVWFSKWDERVTIWGMSYGAGDNLWPNNQRIHQFIAGQPISVPGVKPQKIDRDVEDATIVAGNVSKNAVLTPWP